MVIQQDTIRKNYWLHLFAVVTRFGIYMYVPKLILWFENNDTAKRTLIEKEHGGGKFEGVTLNPTVMVLKEDMREAAFKLHENSNGCCFIANSVNFNITHKPIIKSLEDYKKYIL